MATTAPCGAVRHGSECFNFLHPQPLDDEFLVVWDGMVASDGVPRRTPLRSSGMRFFKRKVLQTVLEVFLIMCTHFRGVFNVVHPK